MPVVNTEALKRRHQRYKMFKHSYLPLLRDGVRCLYAFIANGALFMRTTTNNLRYI
jgi:hypothetical protein